MTTTAPTTTWARRVPLMSRQRSATGEPSSPNLSLSTLTTSCLPGQKSSGRDRAAGGTLGHVVDRPTGLGRLDIGARLAVVRRHRVRAPEHLAEVDRDRVLVLAEPPQS